MTRVSKPESVQSRILRAIQPFAQVQLALDTNLRDAGMNSLDMMVAIQACQDEFDIDVSDEQFKDIQTVQDVVNLFKPVAPKAA